MNGVDFSLLPIDCGFDLKVHDMVCQIPENARSVAYEKDGVSTVARGDREHIIEVLREVGYRVE